MKILKVRHYNIDDFEIVRFFSYTSTIPHRDTILELNYASVNNYPNLTERFDEFYNELAKKATSLWLEKSSESHHFVFYDNKTVFQIRHKFSGHTYFIGRYDMRRAIGNRCHLFDGRIFDFDKVIETDFISDVMACGSSLYKKFNI